MSEWVVIRPGSGAHGPLIARVRAALPLLRLWTVREFRIRYRNSVLDVGWSVLSPVATLAIYGWAFTQILDIDTGDEPYISVAWSGLVLFGFFSDALSTSVLSLVSAAPILTKVYFPREIVPLAEVGNGLVDLGAGLVILIVLVVAQGEPLTIHALAILPALVVLVVWTAGVAVLIATAAVFIRDLRYALPVALRLGFIVTPVMYSATLLADHPFVRDANPIGVVIEAVRQALLAQAWPSWSLLGLQLAIGLAVFVAGILLTRALESRMVDVV